MPGQRQLAIVKDLRAATHYSAFLHVIRDRIVELELAYTTVDALAGFCDTYTSKLLAQPPLKRMSVDSLFSILGALALVPKFESDQPKLDRLRKQRDWQKRKKAKPIPAAGRDSPITLYLSSGFMREIAVKGGEARMSKLTAKQRSALARRATGSGGAARRKSSRQPTSQPQ